VLDFDAFEETCAVGARAHQAARSVRVVAGMASHRAELDVLEARLRVSHPDLAWLDGMRAFKAGADAGIVPAVRRGESPADRLAALCWRWGPPAG
jgi:hypothetical protein